MNGQNGRFHSRIVIFLPEIVSLVAIRATHKPLCILLMPIIETCPYPYKKQIVLGPKVS